MTGNIEERNASQECNHAQTVTDPETGHSFCESCGLLLPEAPVPVGSRFIPTEEFVRRVAIKIQELNHEILLKQQMQQRLRIVAGKVRDASCAWPNCKTLAIGRSKWCPMHRQQNAREQARKRKRKQRQKPVSLT